MLALNSYRIFLYTGVCDLRKGFDGMTGVVRNKMQLDPMNGAIYVFFNKRRNLIKLLVWDTTGFAIYYKRLSKGTFGQFNAELQSASHDVKREDLLCVLEGINLKSISKRKRYSHPSNP